MGHRLELHNELVGILGSSNVYFDPPESMRIAYPCFVYELDTMPTDFANNNPYVVFERYRVTYMDRNPDSSIIEELKYSSGYYFDRYFPSDNIHHYVFKRIFS